MGDVALVLRFLFSLSPNEKLGQSSEITHVLGPDYIKIKEQTKTRHITVLNRGSKGEG